MASSMFFKLVMDHFQISQSMLIQSMGQNKYYYCLLKSNPTFYFYTFLQLLTFNMEVFMEGSMKNIPAIIDQGSQFDDENYLQKHAIKSKSQDRSMVFEDLTNDSVSNSSYAAQERQEATYDEGLPNLNNTCYLNSALQFLFSAANVRSLIEDSKSENQLIICLKMIFHFIGEKHQDKKNLLKMKKIQLKKLLRIIEKNHDNFELNSQQDSQDILLFLIECISLSQPEILNIFTIKYLSKCKCMNEFQNYLCQNINIPLKLPSCTSCKRNEEIILEQEPSYLICIGDKKIKGPGSIYFTNTNKQTVQYSICAKILYYGSGSTGHYISSRKDMNGQFAFYNDMKVQLEGDRPPRQSITTFLYERIGLTDKILANVKNYIDEDPHQVIEKKYSDNMLDRFMNKLPFGFNNSSEKQQSVDKKDQLKLKKTLCKFGAQNLIYFGGIEVIKSVIDGKIEKYNRKIIFKLHYYSVEYSKFSKSEILTAEILNYPCFSYLKEYKLMHGLINKENTWIKQRQTTLEEILIAIERKMLEIAQSSEQFLFYPEQFNKSEYFYSFSEGMDFDDKNGKFSQFYYKKYLTKSEMSL